MSLEGLDVGRVLIVVGWTVAMAALGTVLAGNAVKTWYPTLTKGRIEIPLTLFALVGLVCYVFEAIVGYRLLERINESPTAVLVLFALVVVMLYNELWNAALFRWRSPFAGLVALLGFLAPLAILLVGCALVDTPSLVLMSLYSVWVVGYDLPWIYGLWRANPTPVADGAGEGEPAAAEA
jgi:benzodiazapine receptor